MSAKAAPESVRYLPCRSPQHADDSVTNCPRGECMPGPNPDIVPGCWARFAAWSLGPRNPPRQVAWVNERQVCGLAPRPGWRTFARSCDLVVVTRTELRAFQAARGHVDLPADPPA